MCLSVYLASAVPGHVGTSPSSCASVQDEEAGRGFHWASGLSAYCLWTRSSDQLTASHRWLLYRAEKGQVETENQSYVYRGTTADTAAAYSDTPAKEIFQ